MRNKIKKIVLSAALLSGVVINCQEIALWFNNYTPRDLIVKPVDSFSKERLVQHGRTELIKMDNNAKGFHISLAKGTGSVYFDNAVYIKDKDRPLYLVAVEPERSIEPVILFYGGMPWNSMYVK